MKLFLEMNTDDDCPIKYEGRDYCFYGENLNISIEGSSALDCVSKLLTRIEVGEGKADQFTKAWLFTAISSILKGDYEPRGYSGNQEFTMWLNAPPAVEERSVWRHRNGNTYEVITLANASTDRPEEYPITVMYKGTTNGKVWSRPLASWHKSMTLIKNNTE